MRYFKLVFVALSVLWIHIAWADKGFNIGCFKITSNSNINDQRVRTVSECVELCEKNFFEIATISDVFCSCTESIKATELNETFCDIKCIGDQNQICGGRTAQSYYQTGVQVPGPVRNIKQSERSQISITLTWDAPEQKKFLRDYIVRVDPIRTFAKALLPGEWTVPRENNQVDLSPLHPGTTYLIQIISNSNQGEGGVASVTIETEIGIPEPEPQQPTVLSRGDTSLVIEIKPQTNINGPISFYHVIVLFVDNGLIQQFDENLLTNFKQAQDDGTNYYITAELEYQESVRRFTVGDGRNYRGYQNVPLPVDSHVHVSIGVISRVGNVTTRRYASTSHEQHDVMIITVGADESGGKRRKLLILNVNKQEITFPGETDFLVVTLVVACIIFGLLLVCSIM